MVPNIIAPPPDEDGNYCANIRYVWEAECEQPQFIRWIVVSTPPGVNPEDIIQRNPLGPINPMIFPVAGQYCFRVECGNLV